MSKLPQEMTDNELCVYALRGWANHIETGNMVTSGSDCRAMGVGVKLIDDDQFSLIDRLRGLADKQQKEGKRMHPMKVAGLLFAAIKSHLRDNVTLTLQTTTDPIVVYAYETTIDGRRCYNKWSVSVEELSYMRLPAIAHFGHDVARRFMREVEAEEYDRKSD